jgi:hypothetical protein
MASPPALSAAPRNGGESARQPTGAVVGHIVALVVSALAWRVVELIHGGRFGEFAAECDAILAGRPFSPAFQNRLLGPWLLRNVTGLAGVSSPKAFSILLFAFLACAHAVSFESLRRLRGNAASALQSTVLSCAAFVLLTDSGWLKVWDAPDYLVFHLLAVCILWQTRPGWIAALFAVAIGNRESALFVALWLVLSAVDFRPEPPRAWPRIGRPRVLGLGVALGALGATLVMVLRRRLWLGTDVKLPTLTFAGNPLKLWDNLAWLRGSLSAPGPDLLVVLSVALALALGWAGARRLSSRGVACLWLVGAMALANLLFAQIDETRVWIACIPVGMAALLLREETATRHTAEGRRRSADTPRAE